MMRRFNWFIVGCVLVLFSSDLDGFKKPFRNRRHPDAIPNSHRPDEVDIAANLEYCVRNPVRLPGIVLDETDASLVGAWQYSTHTPPYVGYGYLHDQKTGKGEKKVIYRFKVSRTNEYEIRMSHCYNVRRSTNTLVRIEGPNVERKLRINQQVTPEINKLWRSLGNYSLIAKETYYITISNEGTEGKYVIADAFHILPSENK